MAVLMVEHVFIIDMPILLYSEASQMLICFVFNFMCSDHKTKIATFKIFATVFLATLKGSIFVDLINYFYCP